MTDFIEQARQLAQHQLDNGAAPHQMARESLARLEVALAAMENLPAPPLGDTSSVAAMLRYHLAMVERLVTLHEAVTNVSPPDPVRLDEYQRIRKAMGLAPLKVENEHRHNLVSDGTTTVCLNQPCPGLPPEDL